MAMDMDDDDDEPILSSSSSSNAAIVIADDNDNDPIITSYPIFLNPSLPASRKLYILQQPNRLSTAPAHPVAAEMRLKPKAGMVELDVPLDYLAPNYDRDKGMTWGRSLHVATAARNGGSLGLPGGFGVGSAPAGRPAGPKGADTGAGAGARRKKHVEGIDDALEDDAVLDWQDAIRHDRLFRRQTLGGQIPPSTEVQYMVGVFQGQELHLTPASTLVHLRPQLHHIDSAALAQDRPGPNKPDAAPPAARAIHMTIKAADGSDVMTTETMADRLRAVQLEPWNKLRYTDENDEAAWDVYGDSLFLKGHGPAAAAAEVADEKGKQPAATTAIKAPPAAAAAAVEAAAQRLERVWTDEKLMRVVSGMKKGRDGIRAKTPGGGDQDDEAVEELTKKRVKFQS